MNAVLDRPTLEYQEAMARACRLREYDKPLEYPAGATLRFYYTLSENLKHARLTDALFIAKDKTEIKFDLSVFSDQELEDVREEIEADL